MTKQKSPALEVLALPVEFQKLPEAVVNWDRQAGVLQVYFRQPISLCKINFQIHHCLHLEMFLWDEGIQSMEVNHWSPAFWDRKDVAKKSFRCIGRFYCLLSQQGLHFVVYGLLLLE